MKTVNEFRSDGVFTTAHEAGAVLVSCSDFRFWEGHNQQFAGRLQEEVGGIDQIVVPGGPLALLSDDSSEVVAGWLEVLKGLHNLQTIYLLQHGQCGAYRLTYPDKTPEEVQVIQEEDLLKLAGMLASRLGLEVRIGNALPEGKNGVLFREYQLV